MAQRPRPHRLAQGALSRQRNAVNNVELKALAEPAGVEKRHSAQHFWELNINPIMLSSTLLDEIGYLPIDQHGADLLFQVISQRYERGSIVLTTNKPFKQWPSIFNNDSTIASAVLDRLLHHAHTIVIECSSYRMEDRENQ